MGNNLWSAQTSSASMVFSPSMTSHRFSYEALGTHFGITVWDTIDDDVFGEIERSVKAITATFNGNYSRFDPFSLVTKLSGQTGVHTVPSDLVSMLRMYEKLYDLSSGKCNPLIGHTISDLGYDADYSLHERSRIRPTPPFHRALRIVDDEHIELLEDVLIDLGALGKGYCIDLLAADLRMHGLRHYLIDGSGDIVYEGNGQPLRTGLEDPKDTSRVIGIHHMGSGAMCSSAGNRRAWGGHHHIIDPETLRSNTDIIATWVLAETAAIADGLATCLFLAEPEQFQGTWSFDYCILRSDYRVRRSPGFTVELF